MKHIVDMRKTLSSALTLCVLAIPVIRLQSQQQSEMAKVRALEFQVMEAYKHREIDQLASMLDDEFVITFEDGSTYSKTGYISFSATPSVKIEIAEMMDLKIRIHGDTAILTGVYHERGQSKGSPYDYRDRFTDVWMKKGISWRLIASHYGVPVKN
jgi:ketosteroid isomerase-like protein